MQTPLSPDVSPYEVYQLFATDEIFEHIVIETNRYAKQELLSMNLPRKKRKKHRLSKWVDTTIDEMKKFFGLMLWMGLVQHGSIEEYWSTSPLLSNQVASQVMARNRFQLLLACIHFNNNDGLLESTDRLFKIRSLLDKLQPNFQKHYMPGEYDIIIIFRFIFHT